MIYASGKGAQRNLDLALKFACEMATIASAEKAGRVAHLEKLKAEGWTGSNFDVCDDITSGYMSGFCEDKPDRFDEAERGRKHYAITARRRPWGRPAEGSKGRLRATAKSSTTTKNAVIHRGEILEYTADAGLTTWSTGP